MAYDWGAGSAQTLTFPEAMSLANSHHAVLAYDSNALNPHFVYSDESGQEHDVWFLDATTLCNGLMAGEANAPEGYALWSLGSEDPSVWNFFSRNINLKAALESLKTIPISKNVIYQGDNGISRIIKKPESGSRDYSVNDGLITNENFTKYPASYLIETVNFSDKKKIVLTFDDGPDKTYTPQIMAILKQYKVTATFFVIGSSANSNPSITQEIAQNFEIGNHTYTHPNIGKIQPRFLEYELNATQRVIENLTGHNTVLFRSPYAFDADPVYPRDLTALETISDFGYYNVPIGADSSDWQKGDVQDLVGRVINSVEKDGERIILFHDGGGDRSQTVQALPQVIERLQKDGYEFTTISESTGLKKETVVSDAKETLFTRFNGFGYSLVHWFNLTIWTIFFIGIILGIIRFIMLTSFAATGWIKLRQKFSSNFNPKVSVVISAFNEAKVIKRTINALLASLYADLEIIVINDGSSDGTLEVLEKNFSQNPSIKILSHENMGKAASLNRGINLAKGSIIVTLDADTLIRKEAIFLLVRHFDDPRVGAVAGNAKVGNRINLLTKLQAIEYITSQSHDRRAFGIVNSITVVPGAIGAWRKLAIVQAGGFTDNTLAEDADLTVEILKKGYIIETEQNALGYTEAPDNFKSFLKQRFRWVFGTLQVGWKNRKIMFQPKYGLVAFFGIPNILVFQLFFSILAPIVDLMVVLTIVLSVWHYQQHPAEFSWMSVAPFFIYYGVFAFLDSLTAFLAFLMEKREDKRLLLLLPLQRLFYRQLIYYVTWKAVAIALRGKFVAWEKIVRKNTVQVSAIKA
jgi:cellulose synthase/poly-beta-1,6-N-acetylglucosamine synthase-like glycosyltransferase/peptidoglycan/xylan/chitin deacetylase (PgdA/CDA1 family)